MPTSFIVAGNRFSFISMKCWQQITDECCSTVGELRPHSLIAEWSTHYMTHTCHCISVQSMCLFALAVRNVLKQEIPFHISSYNMRV